MSTTVLLPNEYIHIQNKDNGEVDTILGPKRVSLASNQAYLSGKKKSLILEKNQYVIVENPYSSKLKKYVMGGKVVRVGPCALVFHYNERPGYKRTSYLLGKNDAIELESQRKHSGKEAGFKWQVKGPCAYIPGKYEIVKRTVRAIQVNDNEGIYVINSETSEKKMVVGPINYLYGVNETKFTKYYSSDEKKALGLSQSSSSIASCIRLARGEALCIINYENSKEKVIYGPCSKLLGPNEGVKVLSLSAGKPKKTNQLKVAKIRIGPDFMSDKIVVRTKDNAKLELSISYKWEFLVDAKSAYKIFSLNDFIGYACQSLCSTIREEAANHPFEDFHNSTVQLIRDALFKKVTVERNGKERNYHGLYFPENKFLVSEVDVKQVKPENQEINSLLNQSIKSNMTIVCRRMQQEANLQAQKTKVKAQAEIQLLRRKLIDANSKNLSLEKIEKARIEGQSLVEKAKAQKISEEIKEMGKINSEMELIKATMEMLDSPEGDKYIELLKIENMSKVPQKWYVTTDSEINPL